MQLMGLWLLRVVNRVVGLGIGLGGNPLLLTKLCKDGEKHCFPIPRVGDGAGDTGMKSMRFGEADFSTSLSLRLKLSSQEWLICIAFCTSRSWTVSRLIKSMPSSCLIWCKRLLCMRTGEAGSSRPWRFGNVVLLRLALGASAWNTGEVSLRPWIRGALLDLRRAPPPPPPPPLRPGPASWKMHYYRYSNAEVSCWYKYLLFSYNIVFWLAGVAFLGAGLWAWSEKGVLSDLTKVTRLHGIDPVVLVLMVGVVMFTLGFAGCVGALRENICLLKFFCGTIVLIFFLELAVAVLAFLFQDWVRDRFREFFESNIRSYRDDIDLQNLIDSLQKANQCCGAYGPEDWDLNVYFNCSGASYSREKCGVPFSCCVPDPAQKVLNTQCGYDVRTQLKSKWDEFIFTKGCIPALEGWLPRNIYIVAGVFIAISLLQIFGIFLAKTLISDIEAVKAGHHF